MEDLLNSCLLRHVTLRPDLELVDEIKLDEDSEAETNKCSGHRNFGDPSEMVMIQPPYLRFRWMNLHYLLQQNLGVEIWIFLRMIFQAESGSFDGLGGPSNFEGSFFFVLKDIETFHSDVLKCARKKRNSNIWHFTCLDS